MLGQYVKIDRHPCLRKSTESSGRFLKVSGVHRGYKRKGKGRMSNHFTLKPDALNQSRRGDSSSSEDFRITPPNVMLDDTSAFMKECLLFYYPDCEGLAKRIAAVSGGNVELAEISWKYVTIE